MWVTRPLPASVLAVAVSLALVFVFPPGTLIGNISWLLPGLLVGVMVTILVHEVGHVVGGFAVGERLELLGVGPVLVWRTRTGLHVAANERWELTAIAATMPARPQPTALRAAVPILGGPLANLVAALAVFYLYSRLGLWNVTPGRVAAGEYPVSALVLDSCLFQIWFQSGFASVVNLIPKRVGGFFTDGALLKRVLRDPAARERMTAYTRLLVASAAGERPRSWDPALVEHVARSFDDDPTAEAVGRTFGYYALVDRGDPAGARSQLEQAIAAAADFPFLRTSLDAELAFVRAYFDEDAAATREILERTPEDSLNRDSRRRAEAALLLLEGAPAAALEKVAAAEQALERAWGSSAGMAVLDHEWLADIASRARTALAPAPLEPFSVQDHF